MAGTLWVVYIPLTENLNKTLGLDFTNPHDIRANTSKPVPRGTETLDDTVRNINMDYTFMVYFGTIILCVLFTAFFNRLKY